MPQQPHAKSTPGDGTWVERWSRQCNGVERDKGDGDEIIFFFFEIDLLLLRV